MKTNFKKGFYTQPHTSNTIAITDDGAYYVSTINGKKYISNERVIATSIINSWNYQSF